jgi:hypothetical protein
MAVKERPGLRQVAPGLYESTDGHSSGRLTTDYADAVRKHSGSRVLERIVEKAVERQKSKASKGHSA